MKSSVRENLKKMKKTYMTCLHSEPNTSIKQDMFLFGTRLGLLTMSLTGTHVGLKKPFKKDFILIKLTETMKPKLPKHEMPTNKTAQRLTANKAVGIEQFSIQCWWYNSRLLWIYLTFSCALGCLLGFTLGPNKRLLIFSFALIGCYVYIDFGIKRALIIRIKIH